jgi:hypothetical protein
VSRQKCTVPETTHDTKTGNTLSRQKKSQKRVSWQKKLGEAEVLFVIFLMIFGAAYTAQEKCRVRPFFYTKLGQTIWAGLALEARRSPLPGATERSQVSDTSAQVQRRSGVGRPGLSAVEPRLDPVSETAKLGPRSTTEIVWGRASGAWFCFFFTLFRLDLVIARSRTSR